MFSGNTTNSKQFLQVQYTACFLTRTEEVKNVKQYYHWLLILTIQIISNQGMRKVSSVLSYG